MAILGKPSILLASDARRLGELLVRRNALSTKALVHALEVQAKSGLPLGQVLLRQGLVSRITLARVLWQQKLVRCSSGAVVALTSKNAFAGSGKLVLTGFVATTVSVSVVAGTVVTASLLLPGADEDPATKPPPMASAEKAPQDQDHSIVVTSTGHARLSVVAQDVVLEIGKVQVSGRERAVGSSAKPETAKYSIGRSGGQDQRVTVRLD